MPPTRAAINYIIKTSAQAFKQAAARRLLLAFVIKALLGAVLAYAVMVILLLELELRLEALFGIGLSLGILVWLLGLLARQLSAGLLSLSPEAHRPRGKTSLGLQSARLHLAWPWMSPEEDAVAHGEAALPAPQKWQYGQHLLLPLMAWRGLNLEETQAELARLRQKQCLSHNPSALPVFNLCSLLSWLGPVTGLALGTLAGLLFWMRQGSGKLVLLQATALGLGLGLLICLLALLPAAISSAAYGGELLRHEGLAQEESQPEAQQEHENHGMEEPIAMKEASPEASNPPDPDPAEKNR